MQTLFVSRNHRHRQFHCSSAGPSPFLAKGPLAYSQNVAKPARYWQDWPVEWNAFSVRWGGGTSPQGTASRNLGLWNATALRYPLLALPDDPTSCWRHRAYWLTPPMFRMSVSHIKALGSATSKEKLAGDGELAARYTRLARALSSRSPSELRPRAWARTPSRRALHWAALPV